MYITFSNWKPVAYLGLGRLLRHDLMADESGKWGTQVHLYCSIIIFLIGNHGISCISTCISSFKYGPENGHLEIMAVFSNKPESFFR